MRQGYKISFLYLLLVLPQHGNSPLPDKDEGDEEHDVIANLHLTDSLTGRDNSLESARETNALTRAKRSDDSELPFKNDRGNINEHSRVKKQSPFVSGERMRNDKDAAMFEEFDNYPTFSVFHRSSVNNERFQNPENPIRKNKFFKDNQYIDIIPSQDLLHNNRMKTLHGTEDIDLNAVENEADERLPPQKRFLSNSYYYYPENVAEEDLNYPNQEEYVDYGRKGREIRDQYKNSMEPQGEMPRLYDENEYYEGDTGPLLEGENYYNELAENVPYKRKRNEAIGEATDDNGITREGYDEDERYMGFAPKETFRRDRGRFSGVKTREAEKKQEPDYSWKFGDSTSDDLKEMMRNSQKALQQVQLFQGKQYAENQQQDRNDLARCEKRHYLLDGSRLKREDEDEQKNMKTGTDEGGGEYEEEEGKGHKDEEEYYEEADSSKTESMNEKFPDVGQNERYGKRELMKDANFNREKTEANDQSDEFELTLQNAPVENDGKSKKSTYRDGEKMNKNTKRRGLKIWDQWGKWSPCSVTCGIGRSTRWRHCISGGCAQGEKEAQIKKCTNPACK